MGSNSVVINEDYNWYIKPAYGAPVTDGYTKATLYIPSNALDTAQRSGSFTLSEVNGSAAGITVNVTQTADYIKTAEINISKFEYSPGTIDLNNAAAAISPTLEYLITLNWASGAVTEYDNIEDIPEYLTGTIIYSISDTDNFSIDTGTGIVTQAGLTEDSASYEILSVETDEQDTDDSSYVISATVTVKMSIVQETQTSLGTIISEYASASANAAVCQEYVATVYSYSLVDYSLEYTYDIDDTVSTSSDARPTLKYTITVSDGTTATLITEETENSGVTVSYSIDDTEYFTVNSAGVVSAGSTCNYSATGDLYATVTAVIYYNGYQISGLSQITASVYRAATLTTYSAEFSSASFYYMYETLSELMTEISPTLSYVITVTGNDGSSTEVTSGATVTYSISDTDYFSIDSETGVVSKGSTDLWSTGNTLTTVTATVTVKISYTYYVDAYEKSVKTITKSKTSTVYRDSDSVQYTLDNLIFKYDPDTISGSDPTIEPTIEYVISDSSKETMLLGTDDAVTYSISDTDYFSIDSETGAVTAGSSVNYGTDSSSDVSATVTAVITYDGNPVYTTDGADYVTTTVYRTYTYFSEYGV